MRTLEIDAVEGVGGGQSAVGETVDTVAAVRLGAAIPAATPWFGIGPPTEWGGLYRAYFPPAP